MILRTIRQLWAVHKAKPYVCLYSYGTLTSNPMIAVAMRSFNGAVTISSWPDDVQGNARAYLHANDIASIAGLPLVDTRTT